MAFLFFLSHTCTLCQAYKLYKQRYGDIRADLLFIACGVNGVRNSLPDFLKNFTSLSAYKRSIKAVDFTQFVKCSS